MLSTAPHGQRVIVTGAAGGLGTAIVEHLVACECRVAALDLGFKDWPLAAHGSVRADAVDLSDWDAVDSAVNSAVGGLGGVDAIVCAAGITDTLHRAQRFAKDDWQRDLDANLSAAFRVVQAAQPLLLAAGGGGIVFVSSVAAELGQPGQVAYAAAKAGLLGVMHTLAVEWGPLGIRCNAVVPGLIETPKVVKLAARVRDAYRQQVPLRRFSEPAEVAAVIAFLLSPGAAYLNGAALRVDGGLGLNQLALAGGAVQGQTPDTK